MVNREHSPSGECVGTCHSQALIKDSDEQGSTKEAPPPLAVCLSAMDRQRAISLAIVMTQELLRAMGLRQGHAKRTLSPEPSRTGNLISGHLGNNR